MSQRVVLRFNTVKMPKRGVDFKSIYLRALGVHRGAQGRAAEVEGRDVGNRGE